MAVLIVGWMFWGMISGLDQQPVAVAADLNTAANSVKAAKPGTKTVTYDGYAVIVPASWPVYDLNKDPRRCVRYDIHAVYLGTPGPDQDCPPNLVGRVDTISIGQGPQAGQDGQDGPAVRKAAGDRKAPAQTGQQAPGQQAPAPGTIVQDPDLHELALAMPAASPRIDATYGTDPGSTEQILATVRLDGTRTPAPARAGDSARVTRAPIRVRETNPAWPKVTTPPTGVPPGWLPPSSPPAPPTPTPTPTPQPTGPVLAGNPAPAPPTPGGALAGFDTCAAPSLATMKAWRAKYAATAIYIGGQMMACGQGNLSAGWVQQAEAMGWALMPTFVGLQAPCDSFPGKINAKQAASQGTAAANQAVAAASSYGLGPGSPIYYDMEGYDRTNARCHTAVLTFLDAWTRQLQALRYVPGVYSSADAAIKDLQTTSTIAGHPLAEPKAIWIALWDNAANLNGTPYVTSAVWPAARRSKQYAGNRVVKVGGISLDIDVDLVASAVARR